MACVTGVIWLLSIRCFTAPLRVMAAQPTKVTHVEQFRPFKLKFSREKKQQSNT